MKERKIEINDEQLTYFDEGTGVATILFLHGAFIKKEYWLEQIKYFSSAYRVVAVDFPGHGGSSSNMLNPTIKIFSNVISKFIGALKLRNVIIVGHSFGSVVMLELEESAALDLRGLVEIDHLKNINIAMPKEIVDQLISGLKTNFIATCRHFAKRSLVSNATSSKIVDSLLKDYAEMDSNFGSALLISSFNNTQREVELLSRLTKKLFMIHVSYSPTNEVEIAKHIEGDYELYTLKGTCHYPMLEAPSQLNNTLVEILSKI